MVHRWIIAWPEHPRREKRDFLYRFRIPISIWLQNVQYLSNTKRASIDLASDAFFTGIKLGP
jgi:hypothetical protein